MIGTQVRLNGTPTEIIGVVPEWLRHPQKSDVWMLSPLDVPTSPFGTAATTTAATCITSPRSARVAARPLSWPTRASSCKSIGDQIARRIARTTPASSLDGAAAGGQHGRGRAHGACWSLLGAVGFVLLIACANVAGLLIARGAARRRELAVRTALGAGRGRLMRQLLTESLVLALAGGALGMLVAYWTLQLLVGARAGEPAAAGRRHARLAHRARSRSPPRSSVGVLFGLTPALQSSRPELNADLKDGGRTGTARTGMRNVMVVAQVALALVLLIGAGLMLTSFSRLRAVDPGFRTTELVTVELMLPLARYDETAQRSFYTSVLERLQANPRDRAIGDAVPVPVRRRQRAGQLCRSSASREKPPEQRVTRRAQFDFAGLPADASGVRLLAGPRLRRHRWSRRRRRSR